MASLPAEYGRGIPKDAPLFLKIVEPVVDEAAIFRVVASFEYVYRSEFKNVLWAFFEWARMSQSEERYEERYKEMDEILWRALGQWADGKRAAQVIMDDGAWLESMDHEDWMDDAEVRTRNWPDRKQAKRFIDVFQEFHDEIEEEKELLEENMRCQHGNKYWDCPYCEALEHVDPFTAD